MCGILGVISDEPIVDIVYHGLMELQHRGQDAAGIYSYDPRRGIAKCYTGKGLVNQVFTAENIPLPEASWCLGHVRYPTAGGYTEKENQPIYVKDPFDIALAQNGNVVNYLSVRHDFESQGIEYNSSSDAEVILRVLTQYLPRQGCDFEAICRAVLRVYQLMPGAYSVVAIIAGVGMIAFRDPCGIRPLLHGIKPENKTHGFASESAALSNYGFVDIHSISPGEVVFIDKERDVHRKSLQKRVHSHCSFEFVYFGRPHTLMENEEIYQVRGRLGRCLGKNIQKENIQADVVVPIPDSARPCAISLSRYLRTPYEEGFVKKDHIGRTFIMPCQSVREKALSSKLTDIESVFKGRSVILVDDSIVRGTVSKRVVRLARRSGAKKVYFASSFPPIRNPCSYGIDFPNQEQLIGYKKKIDQIASEIDADAVVYNSIEDLREAIGFRDICAACVSGDYPISCEEMDRLQDQRTKEQEEIEFACLKQQR